MLSRLESSLGVVSLVLLGHLLWGLLISFTVTCFLLGQLCQTGSCVLPVFQAHYRNIYRNIGSWLFHVSFKANPGDFRSWAAITQVICQWWRGFVSALCELFMSLMVPPALNPHLIHLCYEFLACKIRNHRFGGTEMAVFSLKGQM